MTQSPPEISAVIPVFEEEGNIPRLLEEVRDALSRTGRSFEILLVDDGSTDSSLAVMRTLLTSHPALRIVAFERNAGQSAALEAGFREARGQIIVTLDADLQNDPSDIPLLLAALDRADAAVGIRAVRRDSLSKRLTSKVGNWLRNRLTGEDIADTGCSLKAFRRACLEHIKMFRGMHRFLPTLVGMEGYTVVQVKVNHRPRLHGSTKYGFFDRLRETAADVMAVRWMQRRALRYRIAGRWPGEAGRADQKGGTR